MRAIGLVLGWWALAAQLGCDGGGPVGPEPDPVTISFTTPTAGATMVRDRLEPTAGWRGAQVAVDVAVTGEVAAIDLSVGELALGAADAVGHADLWLLDPGPTTLTATARDAAGLALAVATVEITVADPMVDTCREWLELYGIAYTAGPVSQGVTDPVTVATPINGMVYRYLSNTAPRPRFFMDCALARSLVLAAPYFRTRGVVEVADIGVYNYRCIGTGTPPNCPNGFSQHAYAKAIDLGEFNTADGTVYNLARAWVIDPAAEKTCDAATENGKDAWLHELICALHGDDVWAIALTPNYNAAHRDHFHVDLTAGSDFIRRTIGVGADVSIDDGSDDW